MRSRLLLSLPLLLASSLFAATPEARPPITGIAYVRFFESDMGGARVFFADRLGLAESDLPAAQAGGAGTKDGQSFAVGVRQRIETVPLPSPAPASRLAMVGFLTSDPDAMGRYLRAHGVAFEQHGPDEIRLRDPEGNPVAFVRESRAAADNRKTAMLPTGSPGSASSRRIIHAGWGVRSAARV